jgi:hypothetical protein
MGGGDLRLHGPASQKTETTHRNSSSFQRLAHFALAPTMLITLVPHVGTASGSGSGQLIEELMGYPNHQRG